MSESDRRARWLRIETLLDGVLELGPDEQSAWLDEQCADAPELRAEVERMIRADSGEGILEESIGGVARGILQDGEAGSGGPAVPQVGERVGAFRIVREIGAGGMGEVFLAERCDGQFDQRVALKVVRDGWGGEIRIRRFMEERRILAALEHPSIARLLDGGFTESGIPYFAMEYVEGETIVRYADARCATVEQRLALFLQVCEAVSYAHRNLVVHRDLKPGNILVTPDGRAKLLDFGIARLLAPEGSAPAATATQLHWLTPEYASPEQLLGRPVSTASDIYALGILLYELLCGALPHDPAAPLSERIAAAVARTDPAPPSARLGADGERAAVARSTTLSRLRRALRGDLDSIVLRALRPEPEQRYATVVGLANDVRAHLSGLPVAARRGTAGYQARRFARRHRVPISAAMLVLSLGAGLGTAHATAVARERDAARGAAARAQQVSAFLIDLFAQSDPLGVDARPRAVSEFLAVGAERLRYELADDPVLRASMLRTVGKVYENLGDYEQAEGLFLSALDVRTSVLSPSHPDVLESVQDLGALRRRQGQYEEADSLLAVTLAGWSAGRDADRLGDVLEEITEVRRQQGNLDAADSLANEVLRIRRATFGSRHPKVSHALTALAVVHRERGDHDLAERYHREALRIRRAHFGDEHVYVAETLRNLALVLHSAGRYPEARELYESALEMQVRLLGEAHPQIGPTRNSFGALLRTLGDHEAALEQYRSGLASQRTALGDEHPQVAIMLANYASVLRDVGNLAEAERMARDALAMRLRLLPPDHPSVAQSHNILGSVLRSRERFREAEEHLLAAERIYVARLGPEHNSVAINRSSLGLLAHEAGDDVRAAQLLRDALDLFERGGRGDHLDAARAVHGLGVIALGAGRSAEAEARFRRALEIRAANLDPGHPDVAASRDGLRQALLAQGRARDTAGLTGSR
jgi:eukaryotic-like serine/threonine-protein kinase